MNDHPLPSVNPITLRAALKQGRAVATIALHPCHSSLSTSVFMQVPVTEDQARRIAELVAEITREVQREPEGANLAKTESVTHRASPRAGR